MMTESVVVDVSQDWVAACGLQERFMENRGQKREGSPNQTDAATILATLVH